MNWFIPLIGAFIGAVTNELAIRLAFHWLLPRKEEMIKQQTIDAIMELLPKPTRFIFRGAIENKIRKKSLEELKARIKVEARKEILLIHALGGLIGFIVSLIAVMI